MRRRIDAQDGVMTNLMVQQGMEDNLLGGQAVFQSLLLMMMGAAKGTNHMIEVQSGMMNQSIERNEIGEMKRDQEGMSLSCIKGTIKTVGQRIPMAMMNTIDIDLTDKREETFSEMNSNSHSFILEWERSTTRII